MKKAQRRKILMILIVGGGLALVAAGVAVALASGVSKKVHLLDTLCKVKNGYLKSRFFICNYAIAVVQHKKQIKQ